MQLCSVPNVTRRARPYLGTLVSVDVESHASERAPALAFAEIARIHTLMSFHEAQSEVSRLNREAQRGWTPASEDTFRVISFGQALAQDSHGVFDMSIGGRLVAAGLLPAPREGACDRTANWRDIELDPAKRSIRFHKPLWIDLGGIAKGYAVDCAITALQRDAAMSAVVNAGGDLRVYGPRDETVLLRQPSSTGEAPIMIVRDGALASSAVDDAPGAYCDGRGGGPRAAKFCSVSASTCMVADALTKIVLNEGARADALLRRYDASAVFREETRWIEIGVPH